MNEPLVIQESRIISERGPKNKVDPFKPYAWLVEKEHTSSGKIEDTAVIFLANNECPFHCLMCDLWKNTLNETIVGSVPAQIKYILPFVARAKHIKLYNSGSFFDTRAIPPGDYEAIASLLSGFETVIVESHPRFIGDRTIDFKNILKPALHVAIGLETAHPETLIKLNKRMTLADFEKAVSFLNSNNILSRAFILLKPPYTTETEGIDRARQSIDYAFSTGVECCTVIPVRAGNGIMELLQRNGDFSPPDIRSLEQVLEYGISLNKGRVFADTWDIQLFSKCDTCLKQRTTRLEKMNLMQEVIPKVLCDCTP